MLFVSDTNLDYNIVHVPYVRYHKTVTSSNLGKLKSASTDKLPLGFRGSVIINQLGKWLKIAFQVDKRRTPIKRWPRKNAGSKLYQCAHTMLGLKCKTFSRNVNLEK